MKPTDQLREEHRAIETMLSILERMCEQLNATGRVKPGDLARVLEFFKVFADTCHHGKEENVLFPAMEEVGFSRIQGPLAVMLSEHTEGRHHVQELTNAVIRYEKTNGQDWSGIVRPARNYIALLREHIAKEDQVLFPMADEHISGQRQRQVLDAFDRMEKDILGEGLHAKYHAVINELKGFYLSERTEGKAE